MDRLDTLPVATVVYRISKSPGDMTATAVDLCSLRLMQRLGHPFRFDLGPVDVIGLLIGPKGPRRIDTEGSGSVGPSLQKMLHIDSRSCATEGAGHLLYHRSPPMRRNPESDARIVQIDEPQAHRGGLDSSHQDVAGMDVMGIDTSSHDAGDPPAQHSQHRSSLLSLVTLEVVGKRFGIEQEINEDDVVIIVSFERHRSRHRCAPLLCSHQVVPFETSSAPAN
jgi:hypothetical protein